MHKKQKDFSQCCFQCCPFQCQIHICKISWFIQKVYILVAEMTVVEDRGLCFVGGGWSSNLKQRKSHFEQCVSNHAINTWRYILCIWKYKRILCNHLFSFSQQPSAEYPLNLLKYSTKRAGGGLWFGHLPTNMPHIFIYIKIRKEAHVQQESFLQQSLLTTDDYLVLDLINCVL